jgi:NAD(P)-dependent dehydrogenase (short-subunit alcohol dehydrogenase family)
MSAKRVALVTGASRGIGRGIAINLAKAGFDIVGNGQQYDPKNNKNGLFEVKERVEEEGSKFLPVKGDISLDDNRQYIIETAIGEFGHIDVLVNNAGVAPLVRKDILETTEDSYNRVLSINARGPFFLTQLASQKMIDQIGKYSEKPCIIFVSSISAYVSSPSRAEYCISKAALSHTARLYADRLAEYGINVYEIQPGIIHTDMTDSVKEKYDNLIAEGLIPQKRWGYPEDIGKAVVALANGSFAYSTGLVLEVSGGMNINRL